MRAASLLLLTWIASDDSATNETLVWARPTGRQRASARVYDAHVPVTHPPHSRDHADIDHRLGRVTRPAQYLTVIQ